MSVVSYALIDSHIFTNKVIYKQDKTAVDQQIIFPCTLNISTAAWRKQIVISLLEMWPSEGFSMIKVTCGIFILKFSKKQLYSDRMNW